jgi:hypothetical protein
MVIEKDREQIRIKEYFDLFVSAGEVTNGELAP